MRPLQLAWTTVLAGVFWACPPAFGDYISFSGISASALPTTINFGLGTVTISEVSAPSAGTPQLEQYIPNPGTNGYESPIGGVKMGILDTGGGPNSWTVEFAFSQPQQIIVHNMETYTDFEDTTLTSYGVWTQIDGSPNLVVTGLGTSTISLVGANGASGPFGYGHWMTTTTDLFMTYELDEASGGNAGNGIDIYVPEPTSMSLTVLLCACGLVPRPRRKSGNA